MNKKLVALIIAGLLLVSVSALYFTHFNKSNISVLKNCRDIEGYLCSREGQCALTWLKSTESYCCPIKCGSCSQEVLANCSSDNQCIKEECNQQTNFKCEFKNITPCVDNGICEEGEYMGEVTSCSGSSGASIADNFESSDCPKTCEDNNLDTADVYNYTSQKCEHYSCEDTYSFTKIDEDTFNISNIFVTMSLYDLGNNDIGEYIAVENHRQQSSTIGSGCNYPISEFNSGDCLGWSIRSGNEPYSAFDYKFIDSNFRVSGWVFGIKKDSLKSYDTSLIKLTIQIDGQEVFIKKDITQLKPKPIFLFNDPKSYQDKILPELKDMIGQDIKGYGGSESMTNEKVYFIMFSTTDWKTYQFWGVEVRRDNGELIKYKEIGNDGCSGQPGQCPNNNDFWWTPER